MQFVLSLFPSLPYIDLPNSSLGWIGWVGMFLVLLGLSHKYAKPDKTKKTWRWVLFVVLFLATPFATFLFGIRFINGATTPIPGLMVEPNPPVVMIFSAMPWVLAAGMLGPIPAAFLGALNGVLFAFFETHNLFSALEIAFFALAFSLMVRQQYRTFIYRLMRHPFFAGLALFPGLLILLFAGFFAVGGAFSVRLDYAISQLMITFVARWGEILIAALAAELLYLTKIKYWLRTPTEKLLPSPFEKRLQSRFLGAILPFVISVFLILILIDWFIAIDIAREMIRSRLSGMARVASESLPYFLETGQNLIGNLADEKLLDQPVYQSKEDIANKLRVVPYFRQLFLFDAKGNPVTGYPFDDITQIRLTREESAGIELALKGIDVQTYQIPPWPGEKTAQIVFIAAIENTNSEVEGVLLGRADLGSNPFTQPAIQALQEMKESGGEGAILDENYKILYHTDLSSVMLNYEGQISQTAAFFNDISGIGERKWVYYQPVVGGPWSVVLSVPTDQVQRMAINVAIPLVFALFMLAVVLIIFINAGLKRLTKSLIIMADEASLIAHGSLDQSMHEHGPDEVGQLGHAFETMRQGLKARLDELNRLLRVSKGVASSLEVGEAVQPVLEAALVEDAIVARVVFDQSTSLEVDKDTPIGFGIGKDATRYAYLDRLIFHEMQKKEILPIPNTIRFRRFEIPAHKKMPGAIIAIALRRENHYLGALWVGYERPHNFSDEEIRFYVTLAGEANLAAVNARLYAISEIGRQRLEAVLASTPEPVLVFDKDGCLLLLNPASMQVPNLIKTASSGRPIEEVVGQKELINLFQESSEQRTLSRELILTNGRMYYVSVAPVLAEEQFVGKICILRDITHYKELDTLKSDFVATVSHDLRSPLTLMRGYATMIQMMGEMNEQQEDYAEKIIAGIESMTRLVNNLLDLGRVEAGVGLKIEEVSIGEIFNSVLDALKPQAVHKSIEILRQGMPEGASLIVEADRALLEQAIYNMIENAIKYTSVRGQITIGVKISQKTVILEVQDTGIGIAPIDLPHMFEKFYRSGRREAYKQRGTGLGLAIVKSIADRHGGKVWVESQLGKGSTFYLEIPVVHQEKGTGGK